MRKELVVALYQYVNQFLIAQTHNSSLSFNSSTLNLNEVNENGSIITSPSISQKQQENTSSTPCVDGGGGGSTGQLSHQLSKSMSTSVLNKSPIVVNSNVNGSNQITRNVTGGFINGATNIASPILTSSTSMMSGISRLSSLTSSNPNNKIKQQQYQSPTTYNNLFGKVWSLLTDMQNDPCPDVAELANKVN